MREALRVLAALAPSPEQAVRAAAAKAYVILDSTPGTTRALLKKTASPTPSPTPA